MQNEIPHQVSPKSSCADDQETRITTSPLRCLVVEDQALIGMALETYVEEAGYVAAGPFTRCATALAWLQYNTPECAVLDYMLDDGSCLELAQILRERGVPFLIYSGFTQKGDIPPELRDVPWLDKPTNGATILAALAGLTERARSAV